MTGDIDWILAPDALAEKKLKATEGDNHAAQSVAYHYLERNSEAEAIPWMTLAARRGDCTATLLLADPVSIESSDHARWQAVADERGCSEHLAREIERDRGG